MSDTARLLQLCSQALPVGAYAYSGGLEAAITQGVVNNADDTSAWIHGIFQQGIALLDLPAVHLAAAAWQQKDKQTIDKLNDYLQACRETSELLLEDVDMGRSLQRLLRDIGDPYPQCANPSYVVMFAVAGINRGLSPATLAEGYAFSWLENQIAAATKSVPLGQTQAQILLGDLLDSIDPALKHAATTAKEMSGTSWTFGQSLPMLALLSSQHETQTVRLYRS